MSLRQLAAQQEDVVAAWQLRRLGWSASKIEHHANRQGWRALHRGVYLLTHSPASRRQLWIAATLTTPGTYLSHGSAGACFGFHRFERSYEVVTREGRRGRRREGGVLVFRSTTLAGDTTRHTGIPITTAARTLVDLAAGLDEKRLGRAFRESIRLRCTTAGLVRGAVERHRCRPGVPMLAGLVTRYAQIPYARARSDPEGRALELIHDAGLPPPLVNARILGEEADLAWPRYGVIVEIDGPQYHQFPAEDGRKEGVWRKAGYDVRRIASDRVYAAPDELLARCPRAA